MLENMFLIEITHLECETGMKLVRFLLYGEFTQPFVCFIDCNLKGIVEVPFPTSHHQGYFRPCATTHTGRYATPAALYLLLTRAMHCRFCALLSVCPPPFKARWQS